MKNRTVFLLVFVLSLAFTGLAADTLVTWNFPNSPDNTTADGGIAANLSKTIACTATGSASYTAGAGSSGYSLSYTGWDSGNNSKYWQIEFVTTGYNSINVSSKQRSSNTGPKNFKAQYKVGSTGTWTDLSGATAITVGNDFTTGVISGVNLPSACNNQASVYIRWIMTSNTSVNNSTVASSGTSRIDDIVVEGTSAPINSSITITSPNGGESWEQNSTHAITWTNSNFTDNVKIELYNGSSYTTLTASTTNTGSWDWAIGTTAAGSNYMVRISDAADSDPTDSSNASFTIVAPVVPTLTVTSPNGGEAWAQNSTHTITWDSANYSGNLDIELYNGSSYVTLNNAAANTGSWDWAIGTTAVGSNYRIWIGDAADGTPNDTSDATFSIVATPVPTITVTSPNGGEDWHQSSTHTITWDNSDFTGNVKIELYNGSSYTTLTASTSNTGSWDWAIGTTAIGNSYQIKVEEANSGTPSDLSDAIFTISTQPAGLNPGDISIIAFRSDNDDALAFVPWVTLVAGTQISFTDNAYDGTALKTNENTAVWTTDTEIPAGTVVTASFPTNSSTWNYGSSVGQLDGLSTSGDNIFAYTGESTSPSFIYGIIVDSPGWITSGNVTTNNSYLPAVLNAQYCNLAPAEYDNTQYNGLRTGNTVEGHKANIHSIANWTASDDAGSFGSINTSAFVIGSAPTQTITVTSPNGGEMWDLGTSHHISWTSEGCTGTVDISLVSNTRTTVTLASGISVTDGDYLWDIDPETAGAGAWKVQVTLHSTPTVYDLSDNIFNVVKSVSTLAELRAQNADNTTIYRVSGQIWLTFAQTFRNQKWFEDYTGAIVLDDNNGVITTTYNVGDGITGLTGRLYNYTDHGYYEFIPVTDPDTAVSTGHTFNPPTITLTQLNSGTYESRLVKIDNLHFDTASGVFAGGVNYPVTADDSSTGVFRTNFYNADYIDTDLPTANFNVVGIVNNRTTDLVNAKCISPRNAADITVIQNLEAPQGLQISANSGSVTLNWNAVSGATGYRVYAATTANGSFTLLGTTNTNSYTFTDTNNSRFFQITAIN